MTTVFIGITFGVVGGSTVSLGGRRHLAGRRELNRLDRAAFWAKEAVVISADVHLLPSYCAVESDGFCFMRLPHFAMASMTLANSRPDCVSEYSVSGTLPPFASLVITPWL